MRTLWQKIRHYQSTVVSGILVLGVVLWGFACQPTVQSILKPELSYTRPKFQSEVEILVVQVESRFESLEAQEQVRKKLFELAIQYAQGGAVNPIAVAITLGNILGLGLLIDNRRKDVVIKQLKNNVASKSA